MPRTIEDFAVFAAPAVFVLLWSSGFVGAKLGLQYAEPLTYLSLRMIAVVALLAIIIPVTRPKWPGAAGMVHSAATGLMVHGLYLGGVFVSIENGLSAGLAALIVSLQPVLTSTIANRWLGERVVARQWLGLALGLLGVYLVLQEKTATGGATPLAWAAAVAALIGITVGTLYQKRFGGGMDWRPALCIQYAAAGILFSLGAFAFETRVVAGVSEGAERSGTHTYCDATWTFDRQNGIAVGTSITGRPPHRSVRADFPHTAPTSGV
jgi:drug/metabolite transporter (DMT)-like permease